MQLVNHVDWSCVVLFSSEDLDNIIKYSYFSKAGRATLLWEISLQKRPYTDFAFWTLAEKKMKELNKRTIMWNSLHCHETNE